MVAHGRVAWVGEGAVAEPAQVGVCEHRLWSPAVVTEDGHVYRVRTEPEVGLEPKGRPPSADEQHETRYKGFWGATTWQKRQARRAPAADR